MAASFRDIASSNFSLEHRRNEFRKIFGSFCSVRGGALPPRSVRRAWADYLQIVVPDNVSWMAVWKQQRRRRQAGGAARGQGREGGQRRDQRQDGDGEEPEEEFVVSVEGLLFASLQADVETLLYGDDRRPDPAADNRCVVSLLDLYPLAAAKQDVGTVESGGGGDACLTASSLRSLTDALDHMRFFYRNLWFPWDSTDDETKNWLHEHLDNRMNLHREMQSGTENGRTVAKKLHRLIRESVDLARTLDALEAEEIYGRGDGDASSASSNPKEDQGILALEIQHREREIRREAELLECPELRLLLEASRIRKKKAARSAAAAAAQQAVVVVAPTTTTLGQQIEFLQRISENVEGVTTQTSLHFCPTLQDAIDGCLSGDVIALAAGEHELSGVGDLESGGAIVGVGRGPQDVVIVAAEDAGDVLMAFAADDAGGAARLQNVTVKADQDCSTVICVKRGSLLLSNCTISGGEIGVEVLSSAAVRVTDCRLENTGNCVEVASRRDDDGADDDVSGGGGGGGRAEIQRSTLTNSKIGCFMEGFGSTLKLSAADLRGNCEFGVLVQGGAGSARRDAGSARRDAAERDDERTLLATDDEVDDEPMTTTSDDQQNQRGEAANRSVTATTFEVRDGGLELLAADSRFEIGDGCNISDNRVANVRFEE